jgi:hypothetical protein
VTDDHEMANFFTHQYRIVGAARVGGQRLTDVLNDDLTSALELKDVELFRLLAPNKLVASHVAALLCKKGILFAISGEQKGSAAERRFFKHVDTVEWDVFLTLPSFELTGKFHVRGTGDLRTMLLRWVGQFIPLTSAKAVYTFYPEVAFTGDVIIVNRDHMELIGTDKPLAH